VIVPKERWLNPARMGLTLPEATNELAFLATGLYGKPLANQNEYGFYASVNPEVDHPRWSQITEASSHQAVANQPAASEPRRHAFAVKH
jgi:DMSO/TMAO reductase YedYZ molybdopterin-dependent catalytic subunit